MNTTKQAITNAATKHITKVKSGEEAAKASMESNPSEKKPDNQKLGVAKEATKHIKGGVEVPGASNDGMVSNPSTKKPGEPLKGSSPSTPISAQKTAATPAVKKPGALKEDETIKNAATKHVLNGIKAGEGAEANMAPEPPKVNPGEEKLASTTGQSAPTKQETVVPNPKESTPGEEKMEKPTSGTATKQETVVSNPKESKPGEEKVGSKPAASSAPTEKKEKETVEESELALRAGANGKVYEGDLPHNPENPEDQPGFIHEEGEQEECEIEEVAALNEQLKRMKQILNY